MARLLIQEYLQNHSLEELQTNLGVYATQHPIYLNLWHLAYDQLEAAAVKDHPIVRECRGLILDRSNDWSVVSYPFNRFFNWGETDQALDWNTVRVQEKVDGSLMIMYYYEGLWHVSTKGSPSASGNVGDYPFTFAQLFWHIWKAQFGLDALAQLNHTFTYMFELTSVYNRVVTNQVGNEGILTLLSVRNIDSFQELPVSQFVGLNPVSEFLLHNINQVLAAADHLDPLEQEGYVLVDGAWNRLKVKSPRYVLIHHLKESLSVQRIVELIQTGESCEVFAYFPDLEIKYNEVLGRYKQLADQVDLSWQDAELQHLISHNNRRDIALYVLKQFPGCMSGAMFALMDGKAKNGIDWLNHQLPSRVRKFLEE